MLTFPSAVERVERVLSALSSILGSRAERHRLRCDKVSNEFTGTSLPVEC